VVVSRHWLKHAKTSIMSGMGGCSSCSIGLGLPYSTRCSAALPHPHFGEGIDGGMLLFTVIVQIVQSSHSGTII
jgi:hypothetical protein